MVLFYILLVIAAFLNVKLFFKVWNMCDNVAKITDKLCYIDDEEDEENNDDYEPIAPTKTPEQKKHNIKAEIIIACVGLLFLFLMIICSHYFAHP